MKAVILAGGLGTRLVEQTEVRPKPMVEIGGKPILWHILKHFAHFGLDDFYVALGYKGDCIKRYFLDYKRLSGSMTVDLRTGGADLHDQSCEDWTLHLIDTGSETATGGRLRRLRPWIQDEAFIVTYGDGVSNVDVNELMKFHKSHGKLATLTAVRPPARFGGLVFDGDRIECFSEKPQTGEGWINGGYMVLEPKVLDYLIHDDIHLEADALEILAEQGELMAFKHEGFWQCMDTLRDMRTLEALWESERAPWKVWEDTSIQSQIQRQPLSRELKHAA